MSAQNGSPTPEHLFWLERFYDFNVRGYWPENGQPSNIPCIEPPFVPSDLNKPQDSDDTEDGYNSDISLPDTEGTFSHFKRPPTPEPQTSIPEQIISAATDMELIEADAYFQDPLPLPPIPDYPRKPPVTLDLEDAINRAKVEISVRPFVGYTRYHQLLCLKEIKEEEEKLRASMEKICQLELLVRKYEEIRVWKEDGPMMPGYTERLQELKERKGDYQWLLYMM
jgi:hypothetical protein